MLEIISEKRKCKVFLKFLRDANALKCRVLCSIAGVLGEIY